MSKKVICEKCGKELDIRGYHSHKFHCKGVDKTKNKQCPDCKSTNIRVLDINNAEEKKYINMGYLEVCVICNELI